ncbi:hypothetical protein pb186bvf_018565 [Paramecium bursaria]
MKKKLQKQRTLSNDTTDELSDEFSWGEEDRFHELQENKKKLQICKRLRKLLDLAEKTLKEIA